MALFKKEQTIITCTAPQGTLIWESPIQNFAEETQLIVPPSTEAIFIQNGVILKVFAPGQYVLNEKTGGLFKKDVKILECRIYYVNKSVRTRAFWGTPSKIDYLDSKINMAVSLGASGSVVFELENALKVYQKLLGTGHLFTADHVSDFFRSKIAVEVKDALAEKLVKEKVSFFDLAADVKELGEQLKAILQPHFSEYGIRITDFSVDALAFPQEVKDVMKKYETERLINTIRETSYKEEVAADLEREKIRKNVGSERERGLYCPYCGSNVPQGGRFCPICGKNILSKRCPDCNTEIDAKAEFCLNCGRKI